MREQLLPGFRFGIKLIGIVLFALGITIYFQEGWTFTTIIGLLFAIYLLFMGKYELHWIIRRKFRTQAEIEMTANFTFSEETLKIEDDDACDVAKWRRVRRIRKGKDGYLIYFKVVALWLPFHAFATPEDRERAEELFKAKVPDFKMIR